MAVSIKRKSVKPKTITKSKLRSNFRKSGNKIRKIRGGDIKSFSKKMKKKFYETKFGQNFKKSREQSKVKFAGWTSNKNKYIYTLSKNLKNADGKNLRNAEGKKMKSIEEVSILIPQENLSKKSINPKRFKYIQQAYKNILNQRENKKLETDKKLEVERIKMEKNLINLEKAVKEIDQKRILQIQNAAASHHTIRINNDIKFGFEV